MRSAEQFHGHQVEKLAGALQRPGMCCGHGRYADLYFSNLLSDLCWLDERETAFAKVVQELLTGCMRVYGQFLFQHLSIPDQFVNEIGSTYAEAAFRLGYYAPERLLSETEFNEIRNSIDGWLFTSDHTETEILSRFGKPTHVVLGGLTTVHCYGCCDQTKNWVYLDYSRCHPPKDLVSFNWFNDPILRDVRRKNNVVELLPFGAWCRDVQIKTDG